MPLAMYLPIPVHPALVQTELMLKITMLKIFLYTVGTESIQTPLNFSLFVSLQPFAKIKKVHFISH